MKFIDLVKAIGATMIIIMVTLLLPFILLIGGAALICFVVYMGLREVRKQETKLANEEKDHK